jgi:lipid A 3-O-deacylase
MQLLLRVPKSPCACALQLTLERTLRITVFSIFAPAILLYSSCSRSEDDAATPPPEENHGITLIGPAESVLEVGAGVFDTFEERPSSRRSAAGLAEFRYGGKLLYIGPAVGITANTDGGVYGYAAAYTEIALGPVVLTPEAGVGLYREGSSSDLGGPVVFNVGAGLSYRFDGGYRVGIKFVHLSNADLYSTNAGSNNIYAVVGIPF